MQLHPPRMYTAFGVRLTSEIPLPELRPTIGTPQAHIRLDAAAPTLKRPVIRRAFYQASENAWLMNAERIAGARFLVRAGQEIVVEKTEAYREDVVRLFLLGSCMGALLMQRGVMPLHGNVIATDKGAVVLAGAIAAGKSTLTMALLQRGHRLLADDISAVRQTNGSAPEVLPGFPRLKLWADTCHHFGLDTSTLPRIRPELEKYHVPIADRFYDHPLPLKAIYLLSPEPIERPELTPLNGATKLKELQAQLYKFIFREAQKNWPWLFGHITALAQQTRVCLLRRPKGGFQTDSLADLIEEDLAQ